MKVVTSAQMRAIEEAADTSGLPYATLRERAGNALAGLTASLAESGGVIFLAGPGNNGVDGLIAAEALRRAGMDVAVYTCGRDDAGPYVGPAHRLEDTTVPDTLGSAIAEAAVLVDALLGTGQSRPPAGLLERVIRCANDRPRHDVLGIAVDVPTGVNPDTGVVGGVAFRADATLTMGFLKRGCVVHPGAEYCGQVQVVDLGIAPQLADHIQVEVPSAADIAALVPSRTAASNKGSYGRVVTIAGSHDFPGACGLCSMASYRAGAGLVEIATVESVRNVIAGRFLEPIFTTVPERDGRVSPDAISAVEALLPKASAVVYGPGIGGSEHTREFTTRLLEALQKHRVRAAVIDADGLNALSQLPHWEEASTPLVLTPHPGEMSRLTGLSIDEINASRIETAGEFAKRWNKVVVLKGAGTVTAAPDGRIAVNTTGGPNLATGGTGDVLSGIIGGLLAQGMEPFEAAVAGVYLHGRAGDLLRAEHGDAGTVASDLLAAIPVARRGVIAGEEEDE